MMIPIGYAEAALPTYSIAAGTPANTADPLNWAPIMEATVNDAMPAAE